MSTVTENLKKCLDADRNLSELIDLAIRFLKDAQIRQEMWTMGGGTVLMFYFMHRASKDVDIFLSDVQLLTRLTPRLNDMIDEAVQDYDEQSNFVKLRLSYGEIDYIVAPNLTGLEPQPVKMSNTTVYIDAPEEILIKKMFYRAESLKVRDIVDMAAGVKHVPDSMQKLSSRILRNKIDVILKRLEFLKTGYEASLKELTVIDLETAEHAFEILDQFFDNLKRGFKNRKRPVQRR